VIQELEMLRRKYENVSPVSISSVSNIKTAMRGKQGLPIHCYLMFLRFVVS
jgi:hypothetical protein